MPILLTPGDKLRLLNVKADLDSALTSPSRSKQVKCLLAAQRELQAVAEGLIVRDLGH